MTLPVHNVFPEPGLDRVKILNYCNAKMAKQLKGNTKTLNAKKYNTIDSPEGHVVRMNIIIEINGAQHEKLEMLGFFMVLSLL